ncbi:MAG: efflux RND transporter periplasmic adaptor subunit [Planctomycetota bacterium]
MVAASLSLLVAGCGGGGADSSTNGTTHTVEKGSLRITLTETGTLKAKNSVNIKAKIPGSAKIVWLVPEGTEVVEGDKLAELDKTELQRNVDQLGSSLKQLESDRKSKKTEYEIEKAEGSAKVEKAQLSYDIKQAELDRYLKSEAPQTLRKKKLAVEKAESEFERKKEKYDQTKELLKEGFVTASQVEEERIALRAAEIELQSAQDELKGYQDFTASIELRQKKSDLAESKRNLDNERLRQANILERKRVAYEQTELNFKATSARYKEQVEQLEKMTLLAPSPGIVIYGQVWNDDELRVGSQVYNDQPFLQLPDLNEMEVKLGVHEADINKMKPGQKVFVTVDSFKGHQLEGKVTKVAAVAGERDWRSQVRKFEVVVTLDKNELPLKPGLSAKVEVLVGEVNDVLTVPLQSVFVKEGRYFVFVDGAGKPEQREVDLGESNDNFIVVQKGVEANDEVLLWNPEAIEGTSSPASKGDKKKNGASGNGNGKKKGGKP